jgi:integrase
MYISESLSEIKKYRPATLRTGKEWFVEYYVYRPDTHTMARKKVMLDHIKKVSERRTYANGLIRRLNSELEKGWNPFISEESSKSYTKFIKVIDDFSRLNKKKFAEGTLRDATIRSYDSYIKKLNDYILKFKLTEMYAYNFNKDFINKYLDDVYHTQNLSSRTRDNYLKFLRVFCSFMVERDYIKTSPASAISVLGKASRGLKNRTVIPDDVKANISDFLLQNNKHYLLACHILYFCMVRPKEMTYIKIRHIDLEKSVIFIPGETAKNYKDAAVTIPIALQDLIKELKITEYPPDYYLFSHGFKPGEEKIREKQFSHYWDRHIRKALSLPMTIKFYSLKDSGITNMIRRYNDPLVARDQARHSSLDITNIYTPQDMLVANEKIKNDAVKF